MKLSPILSNFKFRGQTITSTNNKTKTYVLSKNGCRATSSVSNFGDDKVISLHSYAPNGDDIANAEIRLTKDGKVQVQMYQKYTKNEMGYTIVRLGEGSIPEIVSDIYTLDKLA